MFLYTELIHIALCIGSVYANPTVLQALQCPAKLLDSQKAPPEMNQLSTSQNSSLHPSNIKERVVPMKDLDVDDEHAVLWTRKCLGMSAVGEAKGDPTVLLVCNRCDGVLVTLHVSELQFCLYTAHWNHSHDYSIDSTVLCAMHMRHRQSNTVIGWMIVCSVQLWVEILNNFLQMRCVIMVCL